jgi:hypothetical protein
MSRAQFIVAIASEAKQSTIGFHVTLWIASSIRSSQ